MFNGKSLAIAVLPLGLLFLAVKKSSASSSAAPQSDDELEEGGPPSQRAARALESLDEAKIKAESARLRKQGHTMWADALDRALPMIKMLKEQEGTPKPEWPSSADSVPDFFLLNPPAFETQDDKLCAAWMRSQDNGGPPLVEADYRLPAPGARRPLTPRERWLLGPYFPVKQDLDLEIVFEPPPGMPREVVDPLLHAITAMPPGTTTPKVFFPNGPELLLNRFWLCVLGHELIHGAQLRIGLTQQQSLESFVRWGYQLSPIEVQARAFQRVIWFDLASRARAYFLRKGPLPTFE